MLVIDTPRNFDQYEQIHVIGDIHGCYETLKNYFTTNPINKKDAYIFLGDYFDRGIENYETFLFLKELMNNENMIFLIGNHEDKLYKYACNDEFKMDYDIKNTIEEFESHAITKSEIRGFIKKLSQIAWIQFGGITYLFTHGGIPYLPKLPLDFYSTNSFLYGVGTYEEDIDKIYHSFMELEEKKTYQIHGHRNFYKNKYNEYPYSMNLEGDIEHGGNLRVLTLQKDGQQNYREIKNDIYNHNLKEETSVYNLVENLQNNKYIIKRDLGDDICSFNFTKEAFYNKVWNHMTTKARGLFIDTKNNKIIARSYNKFFKINEREETSLEKLEKSLVFPVNFYLKYNGFLGILSLKDEELFFASKKTNSGEYVEYFKTIFYQKYTESQIKKLKEKMKKENITIVFEVINPTNDPHIIEYKKSNIILLDMIYNQTEYKKISYDTLKEFGKNNKIEVKELIYRANNRIEFQQIYEMITQKEYQYNEEYIEGFVIEDENGFMVKTKTDYYDTWKMLRAKMEYALKNNDYNRKSKDELEESFLQFLKNKYETKEVDPKKINIIEERKEYEKTRTLEESHT